MTDHDVLAPSLTDMEIRQMLLRRAGHADDDRLDESIRAATAAMRQDRRWQSIPERIGSLPTVARLLAVATVALIVAALAFAAVGGMRPAPMPSQVTRPFPLPFEYSIPHGSGMKFNGYGRNMVMWVAGSAPVVPDDPLPAYAVGVDKGIVVGMANLAWSHTATGRARVDAPADRFLPTLTERFGVPLGPVVPTALGGRRAFMADVIPSEHDLHFADQMLGLATPYYIVFELPTRLIVADVEGSTIVVAIWARTVEELDAWLPTADAFVESIHFLD